MFYKFPKDVFIKIQWFGSPCLKGSLFFSYYTTAVVLSKGAWAEAYFPQ